MITTKTSGDNRALLRDELRKYRESRGDLSQGQDPEYEAPHGLGRKTPFSRRKKEPNLGEDMREHLHTSAAETEEDLPTASKQPPVKLSPAQELYQHQQDKKKALGTPPRFGFMPDPGGPLDTTDKQEEYQKRYDAYVDDYSKREAASQDPDEPIRGIKPARETNESVVDYDKRFNELARNYLKKLGSPGHQQSAQPTGGTAQP